MSKVQYKLKYENNVVSHEEGAFFKAIPFSIKIKDVSYDVTFGKGSQDVVVYQFRINNDLFLELKHPDYTPECKVEDLNAFLKSEQAETLFYILFHLEIAINKDYKTFLFAEGKEYLDFEVNQLSFFD